MLTVLGFRSEEGLGETAKRKPESSEGDDVAKQNIEGGEGATGKYVGNGVAKRRVSLDLEGGEGESVKGRGGVSGAARERISRMERGGGSGGVSGPANGREY